MTFLYLLKRVMHYIRPKKNYKWHICKDKWSKSRELHTYAHTMPGKAHESQSKPDQ